MHVQVRAEGLFEHPELHARYVVILEILTPIKQNLHIFGSEKVLATLLFHCRLHRYCNTNHLVATSVKVAKRSDSMSMLSALVAVKVFNNQSFIL